MSGAPFADERAFAFLRGSNMDKRVGETSARHLVMICEFFQPCIISRFPERWECAESFIGAPAGCQYQCCQRRTFLNRPSGGVTGKRGGVWKMSSINRCFENCCLGKCYCKKGKGGFEPPIVCGAPPL